MKFTGNFGELTLHINGTEATGNYQEDGTLEGKFVDNSFYGQWRNKGMEGLVEFKITDNKLEGSWKKGLEPGPMRGKWEGELVDSINFIDSEYSIENQEDWDIDLVAIKEILFTNCEGVSGQDVALRTSSFQPVDNFNGIIDYLIFIFSDDDVNYLFKYKKYPDGAITLFASTYLLQLGGDVFEDDIYEYSTSELIELLNKNGVNKLLLSIVENYSEEGNLTVGDLIEHLLVKSGQIVNVECIDNSYGNSNYEIKT